MHYGFRSGKSWQGGLLEEEAIQVSRSEWRGREHEFLQESAGPGQRELGVRACSVAPMEWNAFRWCVARPSIRRGRHLRGGSWGIKPALVEPSQTPGVPCKNKSTCRLSVSMAPTLVSSPHLQTCLASGKPQRTFFFLIVEQSAKPVRR